MRLKVVSKIVEGEGWSSRQTWVENSETGEVIKGIKSVAWRQGGVDEIPELTLTVFDADAEIACHVRTKVEGS